jgi:excisionase family DNA binding protein
MPVNYKGKKSETDQPPLLDQAAPSARQLRPLLSVKEAADYLGVSESWLNKARCTGDGPPFHKIGRRVLYGVAELVAWLAQRKVRSTSALAS